MGTMRLYTTPQYTLHVKDIDLTGYDVYVTFRQNDVVITKDDGVLTYSDGNTNIVVNLSQAETSQFKLRPGIYVQVNWMNGDDRFATSIAELPPLANLLEEVLE